MQTGTPTTLAVKTAIENLKTELQKEYGRKFSLIVMGDEAAKFHGFNPKMIAGLNGMDLNNAIYPITGKDSLTKRD